MGKQINIYWWRKTTKRGKLMPYLSSILCIYQQILVQCSIIVFCTLIYNERIKFFLFVMIGCFCNCINAFGVWFNSIWSMDSWISFQHYHHCSLLLLRLVLFNLFSYNERSDILYWSIHVILCKLDEIAIKIGWFFKIWFVPKCVCVCVYGNYRNRIKVSELVGLQFQWTTY